MMFYDYPIVAVVVIICIMFAGLYIMIPMFELKQIVHIQKEIEMVNIDKIPNENERIRKINELDKISESIFGDSVNKLLMIISIIMPIATLIFQTLL